MDEHCAGGDGLHVSLQVNTFGKFMDIVEGKEEIESLCYEVAGRVLQKMSVYYRFEFERKDNFLVEMEKIFPRTVRIIPVEEGKDKSDCTILVNNFRVGNYEFKMNSQALRQIQITRILDTLSISKHLVRMNVH